MQISLAETEAEEKRMAEAAAEAAELARKVNACTYRR